jgi:hypothetical protein
MDSGGVISGVAKKKPDERRTTNPDVSRVERVAMVTIRGTEDWRSWLSRLAEYDRSTSISEMMDRALVAYARQIGFKEMPPKR